MTLTMTTETRKMMKMKKEVYLKFNLILNINVI